MKKFRYILCALTLLVAGATAHAQVFDVTITPSDGSEVFSMTNATLIEIYPGNTSPVRVFSGADPQGASLPVAHGVRYDFALTPVTTINPGSGDLPEGNFPAHAPKRKAVEEPSFTEPELTGPALVIMREEGDPIIYYAKDAAEEPINLRCNAKGEYVIGDTKVQGTVIAVFYKDAHTSTAHPAVEPTSEADGNIAYWSCAADGCGKYFADEYCTEEITENSWVRTMVSGTIKWEDDNDNDGKRPESVTVNLFAGGEAPINEQVVTASDNWKYSFTDLPKYNGGNAIDYSISVSNVEDYVISKDGNDVTYTHENETISISGTITWEDNDNTDGKRPESVQITIFANGFDWEDITVTSSDDWVFSVTDLPKYNQKQEIVYSISAPTVEGYTSAKTGNDVTYTIVPATMSLDDTTDPTSTLQALVAANATQDITLNGRTLYKDGYYNTLCLPFALSAGQLEDDNCPLKGCTLKEVTDASLNTETNVMTIELTQVSALEAGKPYLIKWEAASEDIVEPTFTEVKITKSEPSTFEGDNLDVMGIFAPKTMASTDTDLFFLGAENKFYTSNVEAGANLKGYRCYFKSKSASEAKALKFIIEDEDATGISELIGESLEVKEGKYLENGRVVIMRNGKKYNINGQIIK